MLKSVYSNLLKAAFLVIMLTLLFACYENKEVELKNAAVVSAHPLATKIGFEILKKGGNAADAAIATEFALAVCFPSAGNIGGGGFIIVYKNPEEFSALDYREMAPNSASRNMFLDSAGNSIKGKSIHTLCASGVPGTVAGMIELHKKYGSLPFSELIQPAINLAKNGFYLTPKQAKSLNLRKKFFLKQNQYRIPFTNDSSWMEGDTIIQTQLAFTLERIRDDGFNGFYSGKTAELIVEQMKSGFGEITAKDLKNYKAKWRTPIKEEFRDFVVYSMPPPSSGGIALMQILKLYDFVKTGKEKHNSKNYINLLSEIEKRVYADRASFLGDPDYFNVPDSILLDDNYIRSRFTGFVLDSVTPSGLIFNGDISIYESEETTHYSIVDKNGMAISATTTLNHSFGSGIMVKGAGFFLNNEMDDFSMKPGEPNSFGLIGGEANSIQAGKRMLSSMTPTVLTKDDEVKIIVGSPGGSTIITSVAQTVLNLVNFNMSLSEAIVAGRFHHQWMPDKIYFEQNRFDSLLVDSLKNIGYNVYLRSPIGCVNAIIINEDKTVSACSDPRLDGAALTY